MSNDNKYVISIVVVVVGFLFFHPAAKMKKDATD